MISVAKTKCMVIMTPHKRSRMPNSAMNIKINDVTIPCCREDKLLGVHISNTLDWTAHIDNVRNSLKYRLYISKKIKQHMSIKARIIYCNSYILPHLDYIAV
jgi:hypothetical protein